MKLKLWQMQTLGLLSLLLLFVVAVPYFTKLIPVKLQQHVASTLRQQGYNWVTVNASGRTVELAGNAPSIKASNSALEITKNNTALANINSKMTPRHIQPYTMKIHWDGQSLKLNGYLPDQKSYDKLVKNSQDSFGVGKVHGDLKLGAGAPEQWNKLVHKSIDMLAKLQQGHIEITDQSIYMAGKTPHMATRQSILGGLSTFNEFQPTTHIVAADEADQICQQKFNQLLANNTIEFTSNQSHIDKSSYPLLSKLANVASLCPKAHILVEGHTDDSGDDETNLELSKKRAQATVTWLFQQGITTDRLSAVGYGERKPIASNATETGRGRNRRIEFVVKPKTGI